MDREQEEEVMEYLESLDLIPSFRPERLRVVEIIRDIMRRYDLVEKEAQGEIEVRAKGGVG